MIPPVTFGINQVEMYVAHPSAAYVLRQSTSTADASYDGVAVSYGSTGEIDVTLKSSAGLQVGDRVRIRLGSNTTLSTTTDTGIQNPSATGTQPVYIEVGNGATELGAAKALIAIIDQINVAPVSAHKNPPLRFHGSPSGELTGLVSAAEIFLETDEFSRCRYSSASGTPFRLMSDEFTSTNSIFHTFTKRGLLPQTTYTIFVRCMDTYENIINTDDYLISFSVSPLPSGTPGSATSSATGGSGTGAGTGSSGSGSGSTAGGTSGGVSGSGGNRGGAGAGGLNTTEFPYESGDATVIISGYAFPGSSVTVLVDGQIAQSNVNVGATGLFTTTIEAIARGVYTFGVYAIDRNSTKSTTFSTTFSVAGARTSTLSNIHLMPTIVATPNPVSPGAVVNFSGFAIPNSTVTLELTQDKSGSDPKTLTATSDSSGKWNTTQSTTGFSQGTWKIRGKSNQTTGGISTNFSQYTFFSIGGTAVPVSGNNSDLNRDGKVNLIDFSILLFHWNTNGGTSNPPADINHDGKVSLTDFSILVFNWTG